MNLCGPFPLLRICAMGLLVVHLPPLAAAQRPTAPPILNPAHGLFEKPFSLSTQSGADTTVIYTLDGSEPTPDSVKTYSGPIALSNSVVVRARNMDAKGRLSLSKTASYLFPAQVLKQTGNPFPATWGVTNGVPVKAWYGMEAGITGNAGYSNQVIRSLHELPIISFVAPMGSFFDTTNGIYANPLQSGEAWERAVSMEWIDPAGPGFQVDCGLRIQGGWNRKPEECPKHSLRVVFKKKYGRGKLAFPVFGESGTRTFDTLILRGGCNNSWLHWSGEERLRGDYARDQWMRETAAAMGMPAARGKFVQVFINGLYWGLYNLVERPDAAFMAALDGEEPFNHDSRNADKILSGDTVAWDELLKLVNADVIDSTKYSRISELLDLSAFADYMLLNLYGANADWDRSSNWYAGRRREPPGPFQFFVWDGERTLEKSDDNQLAGDDDQSPTRLFQRLRKVEAFRRLFAERAAKHLEPGGVLSTGPARERFKKIADGIRNGIAAEAARWGGYRLNIHQYKTGPYLIYTPADHWEPEIKRIENVYFEERPARFAAQLLAEGLFTATPGSSLN